MNCDGLGGQQSNCFTALSQNFLWSWEKLQETSA